MTEQQQSLSTLFVKCWKDDALKKRFMSDPKAVLAEHGMEIPDGMDVSVIENTDNTVHITMPAVPSNLQVVSDEELTLMAGGSYNSPGAPNCTGIPTCTNCHIPCSNNADTC